MFKPDESVCRHLPATECRERRKRAELPDVFLPLAIDELRLISSDERKFVPAVFPIVARYSGGAGEINCPRVGLRYRFPDSGSGGDWPTTTNFASM